MVQDANASCLDAALDVLLAFADGYVKASEFSPELAPGVVAKGLSGRPGTITRAEAVILKFMEVIYTVILSIHGTDHCCVESGRTPMRNIYSA